MGMPISLIFISALTPPHANGSRALGDVVIRQVLVSILQFIVLNIFSTREALSTFLSTHSRTLLFT